MIKPIKTVIAVSKKIKRIVVKLKDMKVVKQTLKLLIWPFRFALGLIIAIILAIHSKTTLPLHNKMRHKFNWYARWWEWKFHRHIHAALGVMAFSIVVLTVLTQFHGAFALSYWTQTDWSGGVGSSTVNQYSSESNMTTTTADQITMATSSNQLANTNFSSNLTNWVTGVQPNSISGLKLWLEASAISGVSNGSALTTWNDSSGNSNNATQSNSSYKPTYESSGINGLPTVLFNSDQFLATANFSIGLPRTEFVVFDPNTVTGNEYIFDGYQGNTDVYRVYSNAMSLYNGTNVTGQAVSINTPYIGTVTATSGSSTMLLDGGNGVTANPGSSTPGGYSIGDYGGSGPYGIDGDVSEMLVYNTNLTSTQRAAVENYLASKYGITVSSGVTATRSTTKTYNGDAASAELVSNDQGEFTQSVNVGSTATYAISAYAYTNGSAVSASNLSLYANGSTISTTYTSVGSGWYELSGTVTGVNSSVAYGVQVAASQTVYVDNFSLTDYQSSGTLVSSIFNSGVEQNWGNLTYSDTVPSNTTVSVYVRSGNQSNLSDAPAFTSCSPISSGGSIESSCAPNGTQYAQYEVVFSSNGNSTPTFTSASISYSPTDTTPPATNASSLAAYDRNGGTSVSSEGWANTDPYFTWTAATDHSGGSGIAGYCLYLGASSSGNPATSSGYLGGTSPLNTGGACPFAVSTADLDTSISGYLAIALVSSTSPYYLNIDAITGAGVLWNGSAAQFEFYYDNTAPTNPAFISAPSEFVSSDDVTLTWPTTGGDAASDSVSGVAGLQYKIGANGTWYGANHSGTQNCTDLLSNNGTYTMNSTYDYPDLVQGDNIVYFRTYSNACDVSTADVTTVIKLNTTAPSSPQNLEASPTTNTSNSFAFSWIAPASYQGSASNITYCYTVNTLPTSNNCTYTAAGATSLPAGAYATQPGDNTLYLVAKDEAGNINYATASSVTFTANTPAPGIPLDLEIADVSVKATSSWKLALSWNAPTDVGAGIANYKLYRSTDGVNFTEIASTAGASYVDTNLSQVTYYYEVDACDSANNCGAFTGVVSLLPTGKFTSPANLISGPNDTDTTRTATINWVTDRVSDSSIEYGLSSNNYFKNDVADTDQVTAHSVTLDNLLPGTTYYYRAQWTDVDGNTGTSSEYTFTTLPAPKVSNVNVTNINLFNATINFTSTGASSVELVYGTAAADTATLNTSTATSTYSIPLSGLTPGTTYTFTLNPTDIDGNVYTGLVDFSFTTPPQPAISNIQFSPVTGALTGSEQVSWTTNVPATTQISYGLVGGASQNQLDTTLTTSHNMTISNLTYNTEYTLTATSVDGLGNVATSDAQVFKSGTDTRPPRFSDLTIQPSIVGTGASASGQLIVSWKTDKPGTSQVAYGEGTSTGFSAKTSVNSSLVTNHVVVVSGLSTSEVYHVQAISSDADGITGQSATQTTIIAQPTDNALTVVFNSLHAIFGL